MQAQECKQIWLFKLSKDRALLAHVVRWCVGLNLDVGGGGGGLIQSLEAPSTSYRPLKL